MLNRSIIASMKSMEEPLLYAPDQLFYFQANKALSKADVPDVVAELLERQDAEYEVSRAGYFDRLSSFVQQPLSPEGPKYAVIADNDSSRDTAMVFTLPFCNPL